MISFWLFPRSTLRVPLLIIFPLFSKLVFNVEAFPSIEISPPSIFAPCELLNPLVIFKSSFFSAWIVPLFLLSTFPALTIKFPLSFLSLDVPAAKKPVFSKFPATSTFPLPVVTIFPSFVIFWLPFNVKFPVDSIEALAVFEIFPLAVISDPAFKIFPLLAKSFADTVKFFVFCSLVLFVKFPVVVIFKSPVTSRLSFKISPFPALIVVSPPNIAVPLFSTPLDVIFTFEPAWRFPLLTSFSLPALISKVPPVINLFALLKPLVKILVSFATFKSPVLLKEELLLPLSIFKFSPIVVVPVFESPPPLMSKLLTILAVPLISTFWSVPVRVILASPPTSNSFLNLAFPVSKSIFFPTFKESISKLLIILPVRFSPTVIVPLLVTFPLALKFKLLSIFMIPLLLISFPASMSALLAIMIPVLSISPLSDFNFKLSLAPMIPWLSILSLTFIVRSLDSTIPNLRLDNSAFLTETSHFCFLSVSICLLRSAIFLASVSFCNCASNAFIFTSKSSNLLTPYSFNLLSYSESASVYSFSASSPPTDEKLLPSIVALSPP